MKPTQIRNPASNSSIAPTPTSDRPLMDCTLELLQSEVSKLETELSNLYSRLSPVMTPDELVAPVDFPGPATGGEYVDRLRQQIRRLASLTEAVDRMTERLVV